MTKAFTTIFEAITASDPEIANVIRDNWGCLLGPDEKRLIRILRGGGSGGGGGGDSVSMVDNGDGTITITVNGTPLTVFKVV